MRILKVRRLNPNERGSSCEIITSRGTRCNYSARRVIEIEDGNGVRFNSKVCRVHLRSITSASSVELAGLFSRGEVLV